MSGFLLAIGYGAMTTMVWAWMGRSVDVLIAVAIVGFTAFLTGWWYRRQWETSR